MIVEDEESLRKGLELHLSREGFSVWATGCGVPALKMALEHPPDLVLLDLALPDLNGLDLCRRLRERGLSIPIIMLTARSDEIDRVIGLEVGADDYVTKPFSARELTARIRAHLRRERRGRGRVPSRCVFGAVEVDLKTFSVRRNGRVIPLTSTEFEILQLLIARSGEVVTREEMLREIWGFRELPTTRTVDTHIASLRRKLEDEPARPRYIQSSHGHGYRLVT